jgi:hypothetical protein
MGVISMRGLPQSVIDNLPIIDSSKLIGLLTRYSDRIALMNAQADGGYTYKTQTDAYRKLVDSYSLLRDEAEKRIGANNKKRLDELEGYTNEQCLLSAYRSGATGVSDRNLNKAQITTLKSSLNSKWEGVEALL